MKDKTEELNKINNKYKIESVTIRYKMPYGPPKEITYQWDEIHRINWLDAIRCRANYQTPKCYNIDGDACDRPGIRLRDN